MTSSQLSMVLTTVTIQGHAITGADYGSVLYFTINPGAANMEVVRASSNTGSTFTLDKRGLSWYGETETELSAYKFAHVAGEPVIVSNPKEIYNQIVDKFTDETIAGVKTFAVSPLVPTPTSGELNAAASVDYVNNVAVSGAPNASTGAKGIVQEATQAEIDARTVTGSTGAKLFAPLDKIRASKYSDYVADAGATDAYAITAVPAITAYATGQEFTFKANTVNTGAATLDVCGLGAKALVDSSNNALATGAILAGMIVHVVYDGTSFRMVSLPQTSSTNTAGAIPVLNASGQINNAQYSIGVLPSITLAENVSAGDALYISSIKLYSLSPVDSCYIDQANPTANFGNPASLLVGGIVGSTNEKDSLVHYSVASLSGLSYTDIYRAILTTNFNNANSIKPFITFPAATWVYNTATWNSMNAQLGGSTTCYACCRDTNYYAEVTNLIKNWIATPTNATTYGIAIRGDQASTNSISFTPASLTIAVEAKDLTTFGQAYRTNHLYSWSSLTFIGFAAESGTAGSAIRYVPPGKVATGLVGLTTGRQVFLSNTTGGVSHTAGTVPACVGVALSSSTVLVQQPKKTMTYTLSNLVTPRTDGIGQASTNQYGYSTNGMLGLALGWMPKTMTVGIVGGKYTSTDTAVTSTASVDIVSSRVSTTSLLATTTIFASTGTGAATIVSAESSAPSGEFGFAFRIATAGGAITLGFNYPFIIIEG